MKLLDALDDDSRTPLDLAISTDNNKTTKLLREKSVEELNNSSRNGVPSRSRANTTEVSLQPFQVDLSSDKQEKLNKTVSQSIWG